MNVVCLDDCLHHDDIRLEQNGQRISLDKLATKFMGKNVACVAHVNGVLNVDDWQQKVCANDNVVFVALAMGGDKGGKDAFRMIAQIALLVAVTVAAGPLGTALAGATGSFLSVATATQLVSASLLFVGNLAINALFPAGGGVDEAEQFKTLNPQNNIARIGQAIPEVFGEMLVYPDMIATPHIRFIDNKPNLYEVFYFTAGTAEISDLKLGTTAVASFSDLSVTTTDGGNVSTKFDVPQARGTELLMPRDDGLPAQDLWTGDAGWTQWFDLCPQKEILNNDGFIEFMFEVSLLFPQGVGEFSVASPSPSDVENYEYYEGIFLDWRLVNDVGQPTYGAGTSEIRVPLVDVDAGERESYSATIIFVDGSFVTENSSLELAAGAQVISDAMKDNRAQVRLRREVAKSDDSNVATSVNIISLNGYGEALKDVDGVIANLHAGQMKRLPMNGGQTLNGVVKRHIHTFAKNGSNFEYDALQFSNTPSMVMFHLLYEHFGGFNEVRKHVDLDALWFLHEMNLALGETFNARITTQKKFWDWLVQVGFTMRVQPLWRGGRISFIRDMASGVPNFGTAPVAAGQAIHQFNPFHVVRDSFGVTFDAPSSDDVHDGVKLEFIDARVWEHNDYILNLDGGGVCLNPLVVDAKGVTDIVTIKAIAKHMAAAMKYRKINVSFKTEMDGHLPSVGNTVFLQHGLIDEGATEQVFGVNDLTILLEQPLDKDYEFAVLRLGEARASQRIDVSVAADGLSVLLAEAPKVDGGIVNIVSFVDVPESPDTIAFYNVIDDEACTIKITNIRYLANGAMISGFVDDERVYAA